MVIPHGLYDVGKNKGFVHLNTSHDTSELACDSIAAWWEEQGRATIPWPRNCCCCAMAAAVTARRCICSRRTSKSWRTGSASRSAWPTTRPTARSTTRSSTGFSPRDSGLHAV